MDNTFEFLYGKEVAKVYENLQIELSELNNKYELKDSFGNPRNATSYFRYTFEPPDPSFDNDIPSDLKENVIAIFDKYFKRK